MRFFFLLLMANAVFAQRPNILFIMSDDHDRMAISAYSRQFIQTPNIDRLANEGMKFNQAFVGNSICGPARATILTGQHSHMNGQIDNRKRFDSSKTTVSALLQRGGYQTAIVGKWHLHSYPKGFDYWKILPGQGLYFLPRMINMNGDTTTLKGYATDVITDEAINWLNQRDKSRPFFLMLHHKAPHRYFFPPLKYAKAFIDKSFPEPGTLYADTTGKGMAWRKQTMSILPDMKLSSDLKVDPAYLMDIPWLKPDSAEIAYYHAIFNRIPVEERAAFKKLYQHRGEQIQRLRPSGKDLLKLKNQWYMQDYLATVASIDGNVGRVLNYLDSAKLSDNIVVMYTSDQGMYLGQNGWFDKRFMYDVSMQIPLLIRWPNKIPAHSVNNNLVQNIDFAPTFLSLAQLPVPEWMQGVSLKNILLDKTAKLGRKDLYYHFYESYADHTVLPHLGIRSKEYKLIYFYTVDEWELYDLKKDPNEQHNLINDKGYQGVVQDMKARLLAARLHYKDQNQQVCFVKS